MYTRSVRKKNLPVFMYEEVAFSPAVAFLCHHFCGSHLCKYTVCLTQKQSVKFDPLKKKNPIKEAVYSLIPGVCVFLGGCFLVGVLEMFDLISVFYIFIIKI